MVRRRIPPPRRRGAGPHLREGRAGDIPFVRSLSEEVFQQFGDYAGFLPSYVEHASVFTIIAEDEDETPLGFVMVALVSSSRTMPWESGAVATAEEVGEVGDVAVAGEVGEIERDDAAGVRQPPALDAEILAVAVRPEQQSRGCGRRLIDHAIACAREWNAMIGVRSVQLNVAETNHGARRLFARMGFEEVDPFDGVYPRGQRSIRMARRA